MTARSIRRAAERKALKLARKAAVANAVANPEPAAVPASQLYSDELDFTPEPVCSAARLAANRANAGLSTGPRTANGKAISSLNAVKTGLTGRTVLLPADDAEAYEAHLMAYQTEYRPVGLRESELVQSLADTQWRMQRIPGLEMAIYASGRVEFAENFEDHHPDLRPAMIELQTHLKYEKQLRNLQLQEARLHRRYAKESAELRRLQEDRAANEAEKLDHAAELYLAASPEQPFEPRSFGFEFSITKIEAHIQQRLARKRTQTAIQAAA